MGPQKTKPDKQDLTAELALPARGQCHAAEKLPSKDKSDYNQNSAELCACKEFPVASRRQCVQNKEQEPLFTPEMLHKIPVQAHGSSSLQLLIGK